MKYLCLIIIILSLSACSYENQVSCSSLRNIVGELSVQASVHSWVNDNIKDLPQLKSTARHFRAGHIGDYVIDSNFDWGIFDVPVSNGNRIKLLGNIDAPLGVVFYPETNCSIIYSFVEKDEFISYAPWVFKDIEWYGDNVFGILERDRGSM